ncbi:hypothetical protein BKA70DRAFT_1572938 [Coprinopsis sp. MPI-PUGE-AT-0042]|nr:hypothetical protein BKA70DRAFT_1572938 [Coprinopsis sp. MPI-PUGE-AT-0042]
MTLSQLQMLHDHAVFASPRGASFQSTPTNDRRASRMFTTSQPTSRYTTPSSPPGSLFHLIISATDDTLSTVVPTPHSLCHPTDGEMKMLAEGFTMTAIQFTSINSRATPSGCFLCSRRARILD